MQTAKPKILVSVQQHEFETQLLVCKTQLPSQDFKKVI